MRWASTGMYFRKNILTIWFEKCLHIIAFLSLFVFEDYSVVTCFLRIWRVLHFWPNNFLNRMFLHIHNHAIMRCVQVHLTKKVKCVFSFCFTSNSIVNLNIRKDTSKKHEEDAAEVKKDSKKKLWLTSVYCFLLEAFV